MSPQTKQIEPYLMSLLASRLGSISIQMNNAMIKGARSSILALGRDCSAAICDAEGKVLVFPAGFPVHVGCSTLAARALLETHGDDLRPGDAYLNNSPYHGNTHAADHTILVPVFHEDELMFIALCRGHQADAGNSVPTTYHATARDVYEEGALIFPCVRVQRDCEDIKDIIRICQMRIRVPEVWYGDYLAMIGAARIGERELRNLISKYDVDAIRAFCRQYHEYGKQRMISEIKKFPRGVAMYETRHDPIPGLVPEGVTVRVKVEVDPEAGLITCDFTGNDDSKPCGLNLSEATLTSAARAGILNRMSVRLTKFPSCEGALERIIVKMREGSVVGKSKHPFSSSVATTNVNDRAVVAVQCALNQLTERLAMAEPHYEPGVSSSVISGMDSRYGGRRYVTQLLSADPGSAGVNGHDGYLHHSISNSGLMNFNSLEMMESKYPIVYLRQEIVQDGIGSGKWDGAPAIRTEIRTMDDPVRFIYIADGHENPSRGADGGCDGVVGRVYRGKVRGGIEIEIVEELPTVHQVTLAPGEAICGIASSSAGYGDPLERNPELVRHRAREGWISQEKAREVYGVVLDTGPELFAVDWKATRQKRKSLRRKDHRMV